MAQIIQPDNYGKLKIQLDADPRVTETLSEKVKNYGTAASGVGQLLEGQAKKKEVELLNASAEQGADDMVKLYGHPEFRQRYKMAFIKNNLAAILGLQKESQAENNQAELDRINGVTSGGGIPAPTNAITPPVPEGSGGQGPTIPNPGNAIQEEVPPVDNTATQQTAPLPSPINAITPPTTNSNPNGVDPTKIEFGVTPRAKGNTSDKALNRYQQANPNDKKVLDSAEEVKKIKELAETEKITRENAEASDAVALKGRIVELGNKIKTGEQADLNVDKAKVDLADAPIKTEILKTQRDILIQEYLKKGEPAIPTKETRAEILTVLGEEVAEEFYDDPIVRKVVSKVATEFVNKITPAEDIQSRFDYLMKKESPKSKIKSPTPQDNQWDFINKLFSNQKAPTVQRGNAKLPPISGE